MATCKFVECLAGKIFIIIIIILDTVFMTKTQTRHGLNMVKKKKLKKKREKTFGFLTT